VKLQEANSLAESRTEELDGVRARLSESLEDASRLKDELQEANNLAESIGKELGEARTAAARSDDEHVSRYEEVMGRLAGSEAEVARLGSERNALSQERDALSESVSRASAESKVRFDQSVVHHCFARCKAGFDQSQNHLNFANALHGPDFLSLFLMPFHVYTQARTQLHPNTHTHTNTQTNKQTNTHTQHNRNNTIAITQSQ
jgi:hypothetical protein